MSHLLRNGQVETSLSACAALLPMICELFIHGEKALTNCCSAGNAVLNAMREEDLDTSGIVSLVPRKTMEMPVGLRHYSNRTSQYVAINDAKKDLVLAMADMSIFSDSPPRFKLPPFAELAKWIVVDANWSPDRIRTILLNRANFGSASVAFEPVSVAKSARLFERLSSEPAKRYEQAVDIFPNNMVNLATPNQHELAAMHASAKKHELFESDRWWKIIDALGIPSSGARDRFVSLTSHKMTDEGIPLQTVQLLPFIPNLLTKLGADGVLFTKLLKPDDSRLTDPAAAPYILSRTSNGSTEVGGVYMRLFPAVEKVDDVVSVNGVGDTFLGVLIAGMAKGIEMERMINVAQRGAVMTLRSSEAVSPQLGKISAVLSKMAEDAKSQAMDEALLAAAGF